MITPTVITAIIWLVFAFKMNREPSHDYAVNIIPLLQAGMALIVTLFVWLVFFAVKYWMAL